MMNATEKEILTRSRVRLVDEVDLCHSNILNYLHAEGVLTRRQLENIKAQTTNSTQVEKLLDILPTKDQRAFQKFCDALRTNDQESLIHHMQETAATRGLPWQQSDSRMFREVLRACRVQLIEDLEVTPLLDYLYQEEVLTTDNYDSIRAQYTRREQTRRLLELLDARTAQTFTKFQNALQRTQPHLAEILRQATVNLGGAGAYQPQVAAVQQQQKQLIEKSQLQPRPQPQQQQPQQQQQQQQQQLSSLQDQQPQANMSNPAMPSGYPIEIIVGHVDEKYLCSHCELVLRNPMQSFCGHRFCSECLDYLLQSKTGDQAVVCPSCQKENNTEDNEYSVLQPNQKFPDNAIKRDFANLNATCVNQGCEWKGKFREYEKHELDCQHKKAPCNCGQLIPRAQLADHVQTECPVRLVKCLHCGDDVRFCDQKQHEETCPKFPLVCESCNKPNIPRKKKKVPTATLR